MPRHKHADVIIAWANGEEIEFRNMDIEHWFPMNQANPMWYEYTEYRIKPKIVKREGWVNVYNELIAGGSIYPTKEKAIVAARPVAPCATVRIEWEEEV